MAVDDRRSAVRRTKSGEREAGFTLGELLVVLIIIGILAAIAIPLFLTQRNSANDATTKSDVKNGSIAEENYFSDNKVYTSNSTGAAGSDSGPLVGWSKSSNTASVTFTLVGSSGYTIIGVSKSNKSFCYDSNNSGQGVVSGSSCGSTVTASAAPNPAATPTGQVDGNPNTDPTAAPSAAPSGPATANPTACDPAATALCLTVIQIDTTTVTLHWNQPVGFTGAQVQYRAAGDTTWINGENTANTNSRVLNLTHGLNYEFQLLGRFSTSPAARTSNIAAASIAAVAAPVFQTPSVSNTTVQLNWSQPVDYASGHLYYRLTGTTAWTDGGTTTAVNSQLTNLTHGASYDIEVVATYTNGPSATSAIVTATIPASTTPVLSVSRSGANVNLSWTTSVDYTGATISYRPTGSSAAWSTTTTQNPNTNFGGLGSGTYDFTVTANYKNGPSLTSAVVTR